MEEKSFKKFDPLKWLDKCFKAFVYSIIRPTQRDKIRWIVIGLFVLAFLAASLDYPVIWNRSADGVNFAMSKVPALEKTKVPYFAEMPFHLGLDLQGGTHLVYEADISELEEDERADSLEGVRDVIERRVNAYGVAEPLVQTSRSGETWRVIVELAGVRDISEAINMIGETPILEFKEQGTEDGEDVEQFEMTEEQQAQMEEINTEAEASANEALERALAGEDWSMLVSEYSQGMEKANNDGDMGFIGGQLEHQPIISIIESAGTQEGAIVNQLVETDEGLNVLKLLEIENKEVQARHILICYEGAQLCEETTSKDEAREKIEELKSQATSENFEQLARENSTEPGASESGGDLGWFGRAMMVPAFEDAIFPQEVGTISDIIETDFGYHIIYKTDEKFDTGEDKYHVQRILLRKIKESDFNPNAQYGNWKRTELTGKQLQRAQLQFDPNTNEAQVGLEFDDEGQKLFADITERNVGKPVAIFLDGIPISIPTVQEAIRDGKAVITGTFTYEEAKVLVQRLNAGALPVNIDLISQQSVGASLGQDSLEKSLKAGLIGFLLVIIFMILYYRLPGLLASIALILYGTLILALFKLVPVTLTLSGIAGFILSVGLAVDANVLIFERTKEELKRGKLLSRAIKEGFKRAWPSIRDGNLTTLLSCVILFWFSESMVKGFALTLGIGILVSLFSAMVVTKAFLRFVEPWIKGTWLFGVAKKDDQV
ncbi:MAG: protein translocase subunit SecD [Patescibacteria group bacterium]|nr:protein translocase subunit SecD [Patescibacteria group bacterium]